MTLAATTTPASVIPPLLTGARVRDAPTAPRVQRTDRHGARG
jgi:hypothetical protein